MSPVTLEQVETLVGQLSPEDKLQLINHLQEQIGPPAAPTRETYPEGETGEYASRIDEFLAACDEIAESIEGEFDSAEDLRQIRNERADR